MTNNMDRPQEQTRIYSSAIKFASITLVSAAIGVGLFLIAIGGLRLYHIFTISEEQEVINMRGPFQYIIYRAEDYYSSHGRAPEKVADLGITKTELAPYSYDCAPEQFEIVALEYGPDGKIVRGRLSATDLNGYSYVVYDRMRNEIIIAE